MPYGRLMRRIIALALASALAAGAAACSSGGGGAGPARATYPLSPRTVRPDETAVRLPPVSDGDTSFTVLGISSALPEITGSHADMQAEGQFVRIRILVVNNGRTTTLIDVTRQTLLAADGTGHRPDYDAMTIKRQPAKLDMGAAMRAEFDLWYDIPRSTRPAGLRLYGGSTLTDLKDAQGTDLELP